MDEEILDHQWIRLGGAAGLVAVALLLAAALMGGGAPTGDPTAAQITQYLTRDRTNVLSQTVLEVAGLAAVVWFLGTLARLVATRDRRSPLGLIVLAAGAAGVAVAAFDGLTLTTLEFVARQGGLTDAALTHALYDLQNGVVMPGAFGLVMVTFFAAFGVVVLRGLFAGRWLGWVSGALAILSGVSGVLGLTLTNGGTTPLSYFPALGFGVVALASSLYMLRDRIEAPVAARAEVAFG